MFSSLMVTITILGITYGIYKLFELFVRRNERMAIIEKFGVGGGTMALPDFSKWFSPPTPSSWGLRLGLLITGLGLGLCIAFIMNFYMGILDYQKDVLCLAMMLLFGGLGLTFAYLIEQKSRKKDSV